MFNNIWHDLTWQRQHKPLSGPSDTFRHVQKYKSTDEIANLLGKIFVQLCNAWKYTPSVWLTIHTIQNVFHHLKGFSQSMSTENHASAQCIEIGWHMFLTQVNNSCCFVVKIIWNSVSASKIFEAKYRTLTDVRSPSFVRIICICCEGENETE